MSLSRSSSVFFAASSFAGEAVGDPVALGDRFCSSSFRFFFSAFSKSSGFDVLLNTISFPSGDHLGSAAPFGRLVKTNASPPAIESMQSCGGSGFPSFSVERVKTRNFPSGDQRGVESRSPVVNRCGASAPEAGTIQIEVL
jgi:hypothetical protein